MTHICEHVNAVHDLIMPCPFCGGEGDLSVLQMASMPHHYIECLGCGAMAHCSETPVSKGSNVSVLEAIAKWNKRTDLKNITRGENE